MWRLSLVSGRPISFKQDLYQPLYVPRPTVVPELYASLRPQEYDQGQAAPGSTAADMPVAASMAPAPMPIMAKSSVRSERFATRGGSVGGAAFRDTNEPALDAKDSVTPISDASKVGELFQYSVGNVSLPRQRSAMIPILNDPFEVEKLSISINPFWTSTRSTVCGSKTTRPIKSICCKAR